MTKKESNSIMFYGLLLLGALIVVVVNFAFGNPAVEVHMNESILNFSPMGLMIRICIVLGIKAGLYYYSRHLGMNSILAWIDVVLTLFLFISLMYNANDNVIGKGTAGNTVAIMSLLVGVWTLVQLAVFVNFMALKYISDKKEIQGRK